MEMESNTEYRYFIATLKTSKNVEFYFQLDKKPRGVRT